MTTLQVRRFDQRAQLPTRAAGDAGYDLRCLEAVAIVSGGRAKVRTGISVALPPGWYGRIAPRSSLADIHGIDIGAGVVDNSYRGELLVMMFNHSEKEVIFPAGAKIAQLVLERFGDFPVEEVTAFTEVTERGDRGFGSSGLM